MDKLLTLSLRENIQYAMDRITLRRFAIGLPSLPGQGYLWFWTTAGGLVIAVPFIIGYMVYNRRQARLAATIRQ